MLAILQRVGEILDLDEYQSNIIDENTDRPIAEDTRIEINQASCTWGFSVKKHVQDSEAIDEKSFDINLQDIDFTAKSSDFFAIVGEVGSGKSSFL